MLETQPIGVLIVDDHAMVRSGLKQFLDTYDDLVLAGEAKDGAEAVEIFRINPPDVILMDLVMPVMDGSEATRQIIKHNPRVKIVVLTSFHEQDLVEQTLIAGAMSYLLKYVSAEESVWEAILRAGQPFGVKPCGLGARDTLRTEVCYPLYGHELDESKTPIEAGVGFFVALDKGEFVGREPLAAHKANGVGRKCVAFKMTDKSAPPRPHYPIRINGSRAGEVTSGTQSPSLGVGVGMGYVPSGSAKPGTPIEIEIRGRRAVAVVVAKSIYRKPL